MFFARNLSVAVATAWFACASLGCEAPPQEPTSKSTSASKTDEPKPAVERANNPAKAVDKGAKPSKPIAPALLAPDKATAKAPDEYKVKLDTTKGDIVIEVQRDWAPNGADRFYNLVKLGYFEDIAFFRVVDGFMAQFGLHGAPEVNKAWRSARIPDDPVKESNKRGFVTFATSGKDSRTAQMFINYKDNTRLDSQGFSPFGKVVEGMDVVDNLYKGYGEGPPRGRGPNQGRIQMQGNSYLEADFPKLDYIKSASLVK